MLDRIYTTVPYLGFFSVKILLLLLMVTMIMRISLAPYPIAHGALQHFAGDFSQTALSLQYQNTTSGATFPTLYDKCVGSLTSPANQYRGDTEDGAYGFSSLSKKTRMSSHQQMS